MRHDDLSALHDLTGKEFRAEQHPLIASGLSLCKEGASLQVTLVIDLHQLPPLWQCCICPFGSRRLDLRRGQSPISDCLRFACAATLQRAVIVRRTCSMSTYY
jgi:hypothetical protein